MELTIKTTNKTGLLATGLLFSLAGIVLILFPDVLTGILSLMIAITFFLLGISAVWSYVQQTKLTGKRRWYLLAGAALFIAAGVCLLVCNDLLKILLATVAGVWLVLHSVQIIGTALTLKSFGSIDWAWFVLVGLLVLLLAVFVFAFSAEITEWAIRLIGVASLLIGIYYFFIFSQAAKAKIPPVV
jgi:uncharacterized membrane protein HdeD (DUF308 family)